LIFNRDEFKEGAQKILDQTGIMSHIVDRLSRVQKEKKQSMVRE